MFSRMKAAGSSGAFYKMWIAASGLYMTAGRCPCCGSQACPVGLGTAVLIGGSVAGLFHAVGFWPKKPLSHGGLSGEQGGA